MVRSSLVLVVLGLLVAGCGSSSDDSGLGPGTTAQPSGGGAAAAAKFIACFKQPGYAAVHPESGDESLFALSLAKRGYSVVPVNVEKPGAVAADAFLVFFESADDAAKGVDEAAVVGEGDVPPLVRGATVAGYLDQSSRDAVGPAVERCL